MKVGKDRLPPRTGHGTDDFIRWIINVQVMLSEACGTPISVSRRYSQIPTPRRGEPALWPTYRERAIGNARQHTSQPGA